MFESTICKTNHHHHHHDDDADHVDADHDDHNDDWFHGECFQLGGGGNLVLFMVRGRAIFRGTFSNRYGIMGIFFTIFRHLTELWVSFSEDFS